MVLFAEQFFADHLTLPYPEAAVVGDTYYAAPAPDLPLRLRIGFTPTIRAGEYGGLRLQVIHLEHGPLDTLALSFAGHGAFEIRDRRQGRKPGQDGYGVFRDWHNLQTPSWLGLGVAELRAAISQYVRLWFPGALSVRTQPRPAAQVLAPIAAAAPALGR
ncbi:hypothetical protein ACFH04_13430 [Streptomyces noboritoensis]|uniref:Uncharacterized protein n=1 Tax=Streptomyces noboritoensis TaxID=67337 RepID=A0ABV6TFY0_9ACTN